MFFKLTSRNAYRDLVRNCRRICLSELSDNEKSEAFQELFKLLSPKLDETERSLNSQTAYAKRCEHWNGLDTASIKRVTTEKNPWLLFKREFVNAMSQPVEFHAKRVSVALAWFYAAPYKDDWVQ
jgi:hypothetical protein